MKLICMRYRKAIVFVKYNSLDVYFFSTFRAILSWECFRQGNRKVIERRDSVLRET
jgi:hypothetical protein